MRYARPKTLAFVGALAALGLAAGSAAAHAPPSDFAENTLLANGLSANDVTLNNLLPNGLNTRRLSFGGVAGLRFIGVELPR